MSVYCLLLITITLFLLVSLPVASPECHAVPKPDGGWRSVAVADGRVYHVIDAALPKDGGVVPAPTQFVGCESAVPANEAPVPIVVVSTPNLSGEIIHEVLSSQAWTMRKPEEHHVNLVTTPNDKGLCVYYNM